MELDPSLKPALLAINFVDRYRRLSGSFQFPLPDLALFENDKVVTLLQEMGYKAKYLKGENFFRILEKKEPFELQFNIVLRGGMTELIWGVTKDKQRLTIGGPWNMIATLLSEKEARIKYPVFRNYEELQAILNEAFHIYEDFKQELVKHVLL